MSHQQEDVVDDTQEEYINVNEVAEEVADDDQAPPDEEDEEMELDDEHETLEIDMSNNSWTYFDKHTDSIFTIFSHPKLPMVLTGGGDNTAYLWTTHTQPQDLLAKSLDIKSLLYLEGLLQTASLLLLQT